MSEIHAELGMKNAGRAQKTRRYLQL